MAEQRRVTVETSGLVDLDLPLAPYGRRVLARFIDGVLQVIAAFIVVFLMGLIVTSASGQGWFSDLLSNVYAVVGGVMTFFIFFDAWHILFEWLWRGRTPGKIVTGIAVVSADGSAPEFRQCFLRGILHFFDFLPAFYFLGLFTIWITPHMQRFGDLAADTLVIDTEPEAAKLAGSTGDERLITQRDLDREQTRLLHHYFSRRPDLTPSQRAYFAPTVARAAGLDPDEFTSGQELENTLYNLLREQQ